MEKKIKIKSELDREAHKSHKKVLISQIYVDIHR